MAKFIKIQVLNPENHEQMKTLILNIDAIESIAAIEVEWSNSPHSIVNVRGREDSILCMENADLLLERIRLSS